MSQTTDRRICHASSAPSSPLRHVLAYTNANCILACLHLCNSPFRETAIQDWAVRASRLCAVYPDRGGYAVIHLRFLTNTPNTHTNITRSRRHSKSLNPQSLTAQWPVTIYTAWWTEAHCVWTTWQDRTCDHSIANLAYRRQYLVLLLSVNIGVIVISVKTAITDYVTLTFNLLNPKPHHF